MVQLSAVGCGRVLRTVKQVSLRVRHLRAGDTLRNEALTTPDAVACLAVELLRFDDQEIVLAFFVDGGKHPVAVHEVGRGSIDECSVHPREVFRAAIVYGAKSIILAHNHPSGRVEPSAADRRITACLRDAGRVIGIELLDHVIVTPFGDYYSFLAAGVLGDRDEGLRLDVAEAEACERDAATS